MQSIHKDLNRWYAVVSDKIRLYESVITLSTKDLIKPKQMRIKMEYSPG